MKNQSFLVPILLTNQSDCLKFLIFVLDKLDPSYFLKMVDETPDVLY